MIVPSFIRTAVHSFFGFFGYKIRACGTPMHSLDHGLRLLSSCMQPRTVVDIGVASGTPSLYSHFSPSSNAYLLIEADPYHAPAVRSLAVRLGAVAEYVACGSRQGEAVLHTFSDHRKSSMYSPARLLRSSGDITVPLETLDFLVEKHHLIPPYLVKIDVEGAEADVIRGGARVFGEACGAIIEVSFSSRFSDSPSFSDIICLMKAHGLEVFDIVAGTVDADGHLHQADILFIRHGLARK